MSVVTKMAASLAVGFVAMGITGAADAEETIKVGVISTLSGPLAENGTPMVEGIKTWLREHGDKVAGKRVEVIYKDDAGDAERAKRLAQELVTRDHVQFLAGFALTPNTLAVAPVANQAKTPLIVMNAAGWSVTTKSPYITRTVETLPQSTAPMAMWAAKNHIHKVYTLVSDFAPGHDAEAQFVKTFSQAGGKVIGQVRVPVKNPEFSSYLQRIKDAHPDAVFLFLPAGEQGPAFLKTFKDKALDKDGIKILGQGAFVEDKSLDTIGEAGVGLYSSHQYSEAHNSPQNKAFLKAFHAANGANKRANFVAVAAYDGMHMIYNLAEKLGGKIDGDKAMAVIKGMKIDSPRGPISIDPATRDIVQNIYIRRLQKVGAHYYNVEIDTYPNQKDPAKM